VVAVIAEQEIAAIRRPASAAPGPAVGARGRDPGIRGPRLAERRLARAMLAGAAEADAAAERLAFRRRLAAELAPPRSQRTP
jgi:hypothetical protein